MPDAPRFGKSRSRGPVAVSRSSAFSSPESAIPTSSCSAGTTAFRGVPGHEFVGVVEGPAKSRWLGKRVVGEINLGCGRCARCREWLARHCVTRKVLGILGHPGAHAELLTLPESNLREVPAGISDEEAVFTEPLAAACEILDQVDVAPGCRAAVLGAGKLGRLVAQVLEDAGADVSLLGRRGRARRSSFDLVVEATGSPAGMPRALELVRPRGTIVWKSTHHGPGAFRRRRRSSSTEITVVGSRCGRFEPALERLSERRVRVQNLISADFPLASRAKDRRAALKQARETRRVLKVLALRP